MLGNVVDFISAFTHSTLSVSSLLAQLTLALPVLLVIAAALTSWRLAQGSALLAMVIAFCSLVSVRFHGAVVGVASEWLPTVKIDVLSGLMLALTGFLAWVILCYSKNYLAGDQGVGRYLRWLCLTVATVWLLVTSNNLLFICLSWTASSLALHQLLVFYKDRPAARMAAHKKFLISRAADVLTFAGCLILYLHLDTLEIDGLMHILAQSHQPGRWVQMAALLFVSSAILKCAQLPLHGWLLQVMEAPTPVSALLHAGIVNIGGFILLRLSGLLEVAPTAQLVLVIVGSVTAALAALVMMTRISVKVMLAWSTCAQMGFMLLEIGLGAYSLALLHLLAHSLYKAHAFLNAGETVSRQRMLGIAPATHMPSLVQILFALVGVAIAVVLTSVLNGLDPYGEPVLWLFALVLVSSLLPLVSSPFESRGWSQVMVLIGYAIALSLVYGVWHVIFGRLLPSSEIPPSPLRIGFAMLCQLSLLLTQFIVLHRPQGDLSRWLHPRAFAGFHLDEFVTHLTLKIWPTQLLVTPPQALRITTPLLNKKGS